MNEALTDSATSNQRLLWSLLAATPGDCPDGLEEIPGDGFLRLVGRLGLSPFLAHLIKEQPLGLPDAVRQQLLERGRANTLHQLRRLAALREIAASLAEARIPLMVLKGMALAYIAYPNPYCRSMSDVDLLVRRADLEKAAELVRGLGFHEATEVDLMERFRPATESRDCFAMISSDDQVQIEIHGFLPSLAQFGIDSDSLWERSLPATLGGVQVRVLCPEDFLQHICLHIGPYHHYLGSLQGLLDVRFHVEKYGKEVDWAGLAERSRRNGSWTWVYLTLWLARELLGAPVPADFFQAGPAPRRLDDLARLATQHLLYVSEIPMTSSFVRLCAARSLRERWDALVEHWGRVGRRVAGQAPRESRLTWLRDYSRFALLRLRFYVRAGILRPSVRSAAAECQASTAQLLNLMDSEAQVLSPDRTAA